VKGRGSQKRSEALIFGVLADTKGLLSSGEISILKKNFRGADAILHAGPLGDLRVLEQLGQIAKVQAVCGNAENSIIRSELFVRQAWKIGPLRLGLIHGYGRPQGLKSFLLKQFEEAPVEVIVYGRNFEPEARSLGGVYFFNPGSFSGNLPEGSRGPGPSRAGLLFLRGRKIEGQHLRLGD
jgi:putative phosphoesterase